MTLNSFLLPDRPYDAKKDLLGPALVAQTTLYLVVRPEPPYRGVADHRLHRS